GRGHEDLNRVVGMFVNTLALRNYPGAKKTFTQFLEEVKIRTLQAFENRDYPFEDLVDNLAPERTTGKNPLFDAMFTLQNVDIPRLEIPGLKLQPITHETGIAKFELTLQAVESEQGIQFDMEYRTKLFKEETIQRYAGYFKGILAAVITEPGEQIDQIDYLPPREKEQILYEFNATDLAYPKEKTIHGIFEEQVERTPDTIAIVGTVQDAHQEGPDRHLPQGTGDMKPAALTYGKLNREANRAAGYIYDKMGIKPVDRIGVLMTQSLNRVPAILAILKAGGVYIPLDTALPAERIKYMIKDAGITIVLSEKKHRGLLETLQDQCETLRGHNCMDSSDVYSQGEENLNLKIESTAPAYIIYTSGTTGRPKGVILEHRGMANLNTKYTNNFKIDSRDKIIQFANISFDASLFEIFMALLNGAALHLPDRWTIADYRQFQDYLEKHHITIATLPPPYAVNLEPERLRLRMLITAGSPPNLEFMKKCSRHMEYINAFGPTESTICCSYWTSSGAGDYENISIGKPINNIKLYIVNSEMKLQPVGVAGQMCIIGAGLARGYLNKPELTAEQFVHNKFQITNYKQITKNKIQITNKKQEKTREQKTELNNHNTQHPITDNQLYLTGDLARWMPDGNIEFLGRIDHQVKLRGYRVELGEIESRLLTHTEIKEAVVLLREVNEQEPHLCAYFVSGATTLSASDLRVYLAVTLPAYMIPSYFIHLEAIPLTVSGKIDTKALPGPEGLRPDLKEEYVSPATDIEKNIADAWKEVLNLEQTGVNDNFFDIGGNSLNVLQVNKKLNKILDGKLQVVDMFRYTTIRTLAGYLEQQEERGSEAIDRKKRSEAVKKGKSDRQKRLQKRKTRGVKK
ncbi:MAG: amino acid adenylation domain-containing protein, partial [bacterium]|nr:amino acid adenylation domain-containing protein [bacterium]